MEFDQTWVGQIIVALQEKIKENDDNNSNTFPYRIRIPNIMPDDFHKYYHIQAEIVMLVMSMCKSGL